MEFVVSILEKAEKELLNRQEELAEELAKVFILRLKENMQSNKFNFSLAASTIQQRLSKGRGVTPLIDSGAYLQSIVRDKFIVGVSKGVHPKMGSLTFEELSNILEYGRRDKMVPPFPVWRKTFEECEDEFEKVTENFINKHAK